MMSGRSLYLKLYVSFLLIFLVTLILVLVVSARFFGSHLKNEIAEFSLSEARFLRDEYVESCVANAEMPGCREFFHRVAHMHRMRLWVLDRGGRVIQESPGRSPSPQIKPDDLQRLASGEEVVSFGRREPPQILLPIPDAQGKTAGILAVQRPPGRDRFPRFPMGLALLVAGVTIAILVVPLSRRITSPLRELRDLARKWSEGHLEERAAVRGSDEIGELAAVFNGMADNLQRMLQQKKEFLALISHELKSPVARMRIASEILVEKYAAEEETMRLLQGIQQDLTESEQMIEQLLLVSRIEMDMPSALEERVNLLRIVENAARLVIPIAASRDIRIQVPTSPDIVIRGDQVELQRALANVLENAVKFSPGGSEVDVQLSVVDGRARVSVIDRGAGIPAGEQERIFEPFYRGSSAGGKEGSGLGLFLARRIVERHAGTVRADNNPPGGTIITIELPQAPAL